jgi:calcium-dependent protein kinase
MNCGQNVASDEIQAMIKTCDIQGNGQINYTEFLAATVKSKIEITEEHLWSVFKKFDEDETQTISEANLI